LDREKPVFGRMLKKILSRDDDDDDILIMNKNSAISEKKILHLSFLSLSLLII
jgi:hypothetical protein